MIKNAILAFVFSMLVMFFTCSLIKSLLNVSAPVLVFESHQIKLQCFNRGQNTHLVFYHDNGETYAPLFYKNCSEYMSRNNTKTVEIGINSKDNSLVYFKVDDEFEFGDRSKKDSMLSRATPLLVIILICLICLRKSIRDFTIERGRIQRGRSL